MKYLGQNIQFQNGVLYFFADFFQIALIIMPLKCLTCGTKTFTSEATK